MTTTIKFIIALIFAAIFSFSYAKAAPFCVSIQGIEPQCHYFDAVQCRAVAAENSGICTVNSKEFVILSGTGAYCTIDSSRYAFCAYSDRNSCEREAFANGTVCIDNTKQFDDQQDLYRLDPNRTY